MQRVVQTSPAAMTLASMTPLVSVTDGIDVPMRGRKRCLRILTFTSLFPNAQQPLHGLFVQERLRALAQLCDVRVVAPVPWAPALRWLGERYYRYSQVAREELQNGLEVRHPRFIVIPKVFKALDGLLMAACCLASVRTLRRTFQFDLIDAHWAYPDGVAAAILARLLQVPIAITVRGDDINIFPKAFWRRQWIRWALQRADLVIALSEELKRGVEALAVPSSKVVVIPNGVDPQRFHPIDRQTARRRLGLPQEGHMVLSVGRLHSSKGFPVLVEAVGLLKEKFPDLTLVIVGSADHEADARPAIQTMAARYGISDRVLLVGPQPPTSLVDWYGAADLFCLATSREGSANVLLEALACGLPCVTTPVGGNAEIISSPELGVLVPPKAQSIAETVAYSLSRVWDRERIVAHACTRTWEGVAAKCHRYLSRLANVQTVRET